MQWCVSCRPGFLSLRYALSMVYQKLSNHPSNMEVTFQKSDKPQRSTSDYSPKKRKMTVNSQLPTLASLQWEPHQQEEAWKSPLLHSAPSRWPPIHLSLSRQHTSIIPCKHKKNRKRLLNRQQITWRILSMWACNANLDLLEFRRYMSSRLASLPESTQTW